MEPLQFKLRKQESRQPPHERAYWIEETRKKLGIPFKSVLFKTINWKVEWIKDMYLTCKNSENFGKMWWGIQKKYKMLNL